jgi:hypothetical protein
VTGCSVLAGNNLLESQDVSNLLPPRGTENEVKLRAMNIEYARSEIGILLSLILQAFMIPYSGFDIQIVVS